MKNKVILFDWGNIVESHITGYTCYDAFNDLFKLCGYVLDDNVFPYLEKYKISCISNIEDFKIVYNEIYNDFNLNTTFEEFIKLYKEVFDKIDYYNDVSEYEKSLSDRCYIGIFSNLTIFDKERLDKQVDLSKYDYVFLSFEMGYKKPDKNIFEIVSKQLPFKPENILFIDDKDDNIDMAKKFGWNVLKANGLELEKIKSYCDAFLGNIE